jgi:hypothetical protein
MKRLLIAVLACMIAVPVVTFAQGEPGFQKSSFGANFEVSLPTDQLFKEVAGTGYGGNLRYQWGMDARTAITAGSKHVGSTQCVQFLRWREILLHEGFLRESGRGILLPELYV